MSPEAPAASLPIPTPNVLEQDQKLIDRIIYLGSLASERSAIDPMTETLREVTARWQEGEPLDPNDRQALANLETKLKDYLIKEDPLRAFTVDSLEERLSQKTLSLHKDTVNEQSLIAVIVLSVLSAGLGFALPLPLGFGERLLLSTPMFFLTLHIGISWFYLTALRNFNHELRRAFIYFCVGMIILSLGFSHYVIIQLLGLGEHPVFKYAGITWLISIPFICIFMTFNIYAKLLHVKSRLTSLPTALGIAAVVSLALLFAPHGPVTDETLFDFWAIGASMVTIFALMSSVLARKISKAATEAYAKSSTWLYYYTLVVGLGSIPAASFLFILGELNGVALSLVIAICGIPPQMVLLYTGYLFKKETGK
jgi:hypothetical protein